MLEIGARAERFPSRTRKHEHTLVVVCIERPHRILKCIGGLRVDTVVNVGTIDRDDDHMTVARDVDRTQRRAPVTTLSATVAAAHAGIPAPGVVERLFARASIVRSSVVIVSPSQKVFNEPS
jgi:hypothetical protein